MKWDYNGDGANSDVNSDGALPYSLNLEDCFGRLTEGFIRHLLKKNTFFSP